MNSKVFLVVRILLGLMVLVFGLNKFLQFLPPFEAGEDAQNYFGALMNTQTMTMVAIVEIAAGIALILNKYGALMSVILMSVSVNAVLFHATLAPEGIAPSLGLLVLNILALIGYKDKFSGILSA
ncbi:DoxX family membrane protein [Croceitalea rosinachiae]|uniref:DoxX family membrane protein n=1 Tax=Croceitalea rosinachiae TaxID=3075596 RepID=A0ABU3ACK7_9FLAO|nr:DoxX family membrane protein [Croceitalea sp. F388]MDT0607911.1 DoxX family membrane protein [Croceitalea sp. F388]